MEKQEIRQYASDLLDYCNNKMENTNTVETINVVLNMSRHKLDDTDFTIVSVDVYDDKADTRILNAEIMMNHAYTKEEDVKNFLDKVDEVFKSLPQK